MSEHLYFRLALQI